MSDRFSLLSIDRLLQMILLQYDKTGCVFGIPQELFFKPHFSDQFRIKRFDQILETPIGVAAGPHTQLSQNIVASWLTGARFIELKTIQTLDELEISKPCIDMQDEGYNCEWSQELKVKESFHQYLDAWIIIHVLKDKFKFNGSNDPGFIFNMSIGYNYEGILKDNVQWFLSSMMDAPEELKNKLEAIRDIYPHVKNMDIPTQLSNNVTLSTMHGCPPEEIEKIGEYLIDEKGLHTTIKLNPTLLGNELLHEILKHSGFDTRVPDVAFEHDLKVPDAIRIIRNLQAKAEKQKLHFGVKLTNTLESVNHKDVFPPDEKMMYMSGRALHPISVNLARKLQQEFQGALDISFSGGVNAFNVADVLSCGLAPVTVCTDLLKPGGYGRLHQYIKEIRDRIVKDGVYPVSITDSLINLEKYSDKVKEDTSYKKSDLKEPSIKTERHLDSFDCIHAPCEDTCPTHQGISDYLYYTSKGDFKKAGEVIMQTNPFPSTTGMVCDHLCQDKCTRLNYDSPLLIREIKRFVADNHLDAVSPLSSQKLKSDSALKVAIIGAGPSGLSCAYFLALAGFIVNIYETKSATGGMVSAAIPSFRLPDENYQNDLNRIEELGVLIHCNSSINKDNFYQIRTNNDFIYIATGAQKPRAYNIDGIKAKGVLDPLHFLFNVKEGEPTGIGSKVVIVGGGNTAMDSARTAFRLVGENGKVSIVYRRTIKEMPADLGEIKAVIEEGIEIIELATPVQVNTNNGEAQTITCIKMELGKKDDTGRAKPHKVPGTEFEIELDTLIPAIGQDLEIDFVEPEKLRSDSGIYTTKLHDVFIGGDALRGASTAINAIGDGRKVAQHIIDLAGIDFNTNPPRSNKELSLREHMIKRSKRQRAQTISEIPLNDRKNFRLVSGMLSQEEAMKEASRCLICDEVCSICTTVCPNLAFYTYLVEPVSLMLKKIVSTKNGYRLVEDKLFTIKQKYQIVHVSDWCNHCGNCTTFCPTAGEPYKDKPHLCLTKQAFELENEAFFLAPEKDGQVLHKNKNGNLYTLKPEGNSFIFKADRFELQLKRNTFEVIDFRTTLTGSFEVGLQIAAEMSIILQGAQSIVLNE